MASIQFDKRWLAVGAAALALTAGLLFPRQAGSTHGATADATVPPQLTSAGRASATSGDPNAAATSLSAAPSSTPADLAVYVCGAVKKPGVYRFAAGDRVVDALTLAGGAVADADLDQINLAQPLADAMKVTVPHKGQVVATASDAPIDDGSAHSIYHRRSHRHGSRGAHKLQPGQSLDVNTATAEELVQLPGVGPSLAQRIIDYRQQNGPFQTLDDLQNVPGLGPSKFDRLSPYVRL